MTPVQLQTDAAMFILHRSSEWGTQPWHWYFTSALPRAMLGGLPLALLGLRIERRPWPYLGVVISYIGLYSLLPHKEVSQSERRSRM